MIRLLAALLLSACATSPPSTTQGPQGAPPARAELVLLAGGPDYHLEATPTGEVFIVRPSEDGSGVLRTSVDSYDEFRTLYEGGDAKALPPRLPTEGLLISGWQGTACMRAGHVCGRAPAEPVPSDVAVLRILLTFPAP